MRTLKKKVSGTNSAKAASVKAVSINKARKVVNSEKVATCKKTPVTKVSSKKVVKTTNKTPAKK